MEKDKRAMDSSKKILFHQKWLKEWKKNPFSVAPIYIEICPSGACNHRCVFCAFDYLGYKNLYLEKDILKKRISEMGRLGVKAIQFAGEGEPLLHQNLAEVMSHTRRCGIEISALTNGVMLTKKFADEALESINWFQVSVDAGTKETYNFIHRGNQNDFEKVLDNLAYAVKIRDAKKINCEIGAQMILLPINYHEAITLAKLLENVGVDYFTIKPYSHHRLSVHEKEKVVNKNFSYQNLFFLEKEISGAVKGSNMEVDFRKTSMTDVSTGRPYERCLSTPTAWGCIAANGDFYSCSAYLGKEEFLLGNINKQSFEEIWYGEKRKQQMDFMKNFEVLKNCRNICRMHQTNKTLDIISKHKYVTRGKKPGRLNFI